MYRSKAIKLLNCNRAHQKRYQCGCSWRRRLSICCHDNAAATSVVTYNNRWWSCHLLVWSTHPQVGPGLNSQPLNQSHFHYAITFYINDIANSNAHFVKNYWYGIRLFTNWTKLGEMLEWWETFCTEWIIKDIKLLLSWRQEKNTINLILLVCSAAK